MYYRQLDFLRFYAVFQVMFLHMHFSFSDNFIYKLLFGVEGVNLFFTISGFLITGILLDTRGNNKNTFWRKIGIFYKRRFLRIFPLYYLVIFSLVAIMASYRPYFIYDLIYISNIYYAFLGEFPPSPAPHFWSLAVEEQFYLFWPLLIYSIPKGKALLVALCLLCISLLVTYTLVQDGQLFFSERTVKPVAFLSSGGLLACIQRIGYAWMKWILPLFYILLLVYILIIYIDFNHNSFWTVFDRILFDVGFNFAIVGVFVRGWTVSPVKWVVEQPVFLYLGKISYGLYVFHLLMIIPWTVIRRVFAIDGVSPDMEGWSKALLTVIFAMLSWHLIENPIQQYKRKFSYQ